MVIDIATPIANLVRNLALYTKLWGLGQKFHGTCIKIVFFIIGGVVFSQWPPLGNRLSHRKGFWSMLVEMFSNKFLVNLKGSLYMGISWEVYYTLSFKDRMLVPWEWEGSYAYLLAKEPLLPVPCEFGCVFSGLLPLWLHQKIGKRKEKNTATYQLPPLTDSGAFAQHNRTPSFLPSKWFLKWRMSPDFTLDLDLATGYHTATNFREGFEAKSSSELLFRQTHTQWVYLNK